MNLPDPVLVNFFCRHQVGFPRLRELCDAAILWGRKEWCKEGRGGGRKEGEDGSK